MEAMTIGENDSVMVLDVTKPDPQGAATSSPSTPARIDRAAGATKRNNTRKLLVRISRSMGR